jgi:ribonuclease P/MRP protein subunit RPP40
MLDIHRDDGPDTKVYFSHSVLPTYIDPQNVSTKKKPFSTFNAQPFSHTVRIRAERPGNEMWARG